MKPIQLSRRSFVAGVGLGVAFAGSARAATPEVQAFAEIESRLSVVGRFGVAAIDTGSGATLFHRADERFAMCSTFKWTLAAAVLAHVDRGELRLAQQILFSEDDLLPYAPVTAPRVARGGLSIETLCAAIVEVSDNTAANLLLPLIGGPAGLTAFYLEHGDSVSRLDREEPALNENLARDPRDSTTPRAMMGLMQKLLLGEALSVQSREKLLGWMKASKTGLELLRRGLPRGWVVADKTGRSANGAVNDVAVVWPPGRAPILIASYLNDFKSRPAALNAAHVEIAGVVAKAFA